MIVGNVAIFKRLENSVHYSMSLDMGRHYWIVIGLHYKHACLFTRDKLDYIELAIDIIFQLLIYFISAVI